MVENKGHDPSHSGCIQQSENGPTTSSLFIDGCNGCNTWEVEQDKDHHGVGFQWGEDLLSCPIALCIDLILQLFA